MITFRQPFSGEFPITQKYGEVIPGVTYKGLPHTGIDYGCPTGTPILASADGIVMKADWDINGYGRCVIILHDAGHATLYAHLSEIKVYLNQKVKQGDVIGLSGFTGNSTGPHLHFEARKTWNNYKTHFDPMLLPLMSVDDYLHPERPELKNADAFHAGDLLRIVAPDGAKAFYNTQFSEDSRTGYLPGTLFYYTGDTTVRKDNGLTYMRVIPALFSVWIAVNDNETQLLDKVQ